MSRRFRAGLFTVRRCAAAYRAHFTRFRLNLRFFLPPLCGGIGRVHLPSC